MYILGAPVCACAYCGCEIAPGDPVFDTGEELVHDECFFEYMLQYANESGWKRYEYGDEDGYEDL